MHPVARDTQSSQSTRFGANQNDATSSSQVWLTDAKLNESARKLAAADTSHGQSFPESASELAAENLDINDEDDSKWPHNLRVSRANVPYLEKVYANLRQQFKREPEDKMDDLNLNTMIWGMFLLVTQQAAVHMGNNNLENFHSTKNQSQRFQKEIHGISLIDWQDKSWKRTTLLNDRAVQLYINSERVHVFSDSALRMGRIPNTPVSAWMEKINWFMNSSQCRELDRIAVTDGIRVDIFSQDSLHCRCLPRSRK